MTNQKNELDFLCMGSLLVVSCPYCAREICDVFDVLDSDVIDKMRCEACRKEFSFALMECHRCAGEQIFNWKKEPPATILDSLTCACCDSTFRYPNAYQESESL